MPEENGKLIVLEGNRRLAAIRSILNPKLVKGDRMRKFEGRITQSLKDKLEKQIPVIKLANRQDAWRLLGFKHVNGPAKWGSYAKAKYIVDIHRNYSIDLDQIAEQIGDTNKTVRKLYQGVMVIEQTTVQGHPRAPAGHPCGKQFPHPPALRTPEVSANPSGYC